MTHVTTLQLAAAAALALSTASPEVLSADKTEGIGSGVSVTLVDDLGNKHLRWDYRADKREAPTATLLEKPEACRHPTPGTRIDERRGGLTMTRYETAGRTIYAVADHCLQGTGTADTLLKAMELYAADQLLPISEARRFQDRVPMLRTLLAWQRGKPDEARGRFAIGPFQLEADYRNPEAMLEAMGGYDFELSPRPSAYGQSITVLQPDMLPNVAALQVTLARSGQEVRATQAVALIDAPATSVVSEFSGILGAPGRSEQAEKGPVTHRWQRGPLVMELESLGQQARVVWRDTRCTTGPCNPPPVEGLKRALEARAATPRR